LGGSQGLSSDSHHAHDGDTAKAKAAYQDFLTLWKDADTDVPLLKQAKMEYAKLQQGLRFFNRLKETNPS
jgi:hypothetical protein